MSAWSWWTLPTPWLPVRSARGGWVCERGDQRSARVVGGIARGDLSGPSPSSAGIKATTDVNEAFEGVDVAILVGGFPRKVHCLLERGVFLLGEAGAGACVAGSRPRHRALPGLFVSRHERRRRPPLQAGMERKDVMSKNVSIYKAQGSALEKHGKKTAKVRD